MYPRFALLQSAWWGRVREQQGWARRSDDPLILQRSIGPLRFAYAPHAGACDERSAPGETAERFRSLLSGQADPQPHLIRWDVPTPWNPSDEAEARAAGLRPSGIRVQPPDTVVVDLDGDDGELLARMKRKTRYNVRLAEKRGVRVHRSEGRGALAALHRWYALYRETAERDRITIHPEHYYETVLRTAVEMRERGERAPEFSVYSASHEEDHLAGIVTASYGGMTTYLYGASSNVKRNLMASYLIQWSAMVDARAAGDHAYDLFGIPATDDPEDPMHGLYRFKTGFGGAIVHRPGCWDLDLAPVPAGAFRRAERLRAWYFHSFRKRARGRDR